MDCWLKAGLLFALLDELLPLLWADTGPVPEAEAGDDGE